MNQEEMADALEAAMMDDDINNAIVMIYASHKLGKLSDKDAGRLKDFGGIEAIVTYINALVADGIVGDPTRPKSEDEMKEEMADALEAAITDEDTYNAMMTYASHKLGKLSDKDAERLKDFDDIEAFVAYINTLIADDIVYHFAKSKLKEGELEEDMVKLVTTELTTFYI